MAAEQLAGLEMGCDRMRKQHFHELLPRLLNTMEKVEVKRASQQLTALSTSCQKRKSSLSKTLAESTALGHLLAECNPSSDLAAAANAASGAAAAAAAVVPAISLTTPALKAHLEYQSIGDSKGWRGALFILDAGAGRLYQYAGEDSRRATRVLMVSPTHGQHAGRQVHPSLFGGRRHCFGVTTLDDGVVYLSAASAAECAEWIDAVRMCPGCSEDPSIPRTSG